MRLANLDGRATLVAPGADDKGVDVATVSAGRFGPDIQALYDNWGAFREFAAGIEVEPEIGVAAATPIDPARLGAPTPTPRQVFGIGLNYRSHAEESGMAVPMVPATFTKFPTAITGPFADVELSGGTVDWEVELVAVIGRRAERVRAAEAWSYVAGLAVGQDYSERAVQMVGPAPQFSLAKSFAGFGPIGPWLVTPDELDDPDDLELVCEINGEQVQKGRTSAMVWPLPDLVAVLSGVCPLLPGDVIFTGTPSGVGMARKPPRFLSAGDVVVSRIEGIGEIRQECLAGR
jgi:2-keto-4-pentenoate hydratase/2-oxohepta-3-ene-1,7-dioic acid hydratase in catechol pathway